MGTLLWIFIALFVVLVDVLAFVVDTPREGDDEDEDDDSLLTREP